MGQDPEADKAIKNRKAIQSFIQQSTKISVVTKKRLKAYSKWLPEYVGQNFIYS